MTALATRPATSTRGGAAGLTVLGAATFIGVSTEVLPVGLLPQISADLSVSEAVAGLTVTGYALVVALSATPLTVLTARWNRRRLLLTVLSVYAVANALAAVAPTFAVLLVARAVGGLCHGVFWSMNTGYAVRLVPEDQVGRATGAVFTGSALAVAVGLPLATAAGQAFGWRITTMGAAVITVAIALSARILLPPLKGLATPATRHRITGPVRAALARPGVRAVAAITGLIVLGLYVFFSYISVYLGDLGLPGPAVSAALLAYGVGGVVGTVLLGRAYDRWPKISFAVVIATLLSTLAALAVLRLFQPAGVVDRGRDRRRDHPGCGCALHRGSVAGHDLCPRRARPRCRLVVVRGGVQLRHQWWCRDRCRPAVRHGQPRPRPGGVGHCRRRCAAGASGPDSGRPLTTGGFARLRCPRCPARQHCLGVPGHQVGSNRLMGGRPPSAVWRRRVL